MDTDFVAERGQGRWLQNGRSAGQETFYFGSILRWASPVIIVMWYGAGNYFVINLIPSSFTIVVPTCCG